MDILTEQIKNFKEMTTSKQKQTEFNDRMVHLTWKYQKIYNFEVSDRKEHEFWNNEADAFKHTFGSALMEFEMGSFGSLVGGMFHEGKTPNAPISEWNMDSWNNREGRKIAKEIKEEYGERNFRKLSKEEQENIIAHKTMLRMKNGDLITHPDDKREFEGITEQAYGKPKNKADKTHNNPNNFLIMPHGNNSSYNKLSPFLQGFYEKDIKDKRTPVQKVVNEIDEDKWNDNEISFLEGFHKNDKDNHLIKEARERRKERVKQTGNKGKGPNGEDGYWYTTKNGKHVFVPA